MTSNDGFETTDVLIVGCGPTGALLTTLLGRFGIQNIVLEKESDITNDPRGITLDEDGLRLLQELGLYDKIYTEIGSHEDWVYCEYEESNGARKIIRSKFLVGCDGKRGYTRKMYLEPKGVIMEQASSFGYNETWVALNLRITPPTAETHPHLPFWKLGYTPEDVYDLYFPFNFRFICNDKRPAVCGRFYNGDERLWRFEFVVQEGEDPMLMATEKETTKIILPYLTHDGSKYGSDHPIPFPHDCIEVLRSRPFGFSARSCNKWAVGRVILAGDSAHVFPPFGGQGISSGFRDSSGLAWRLAVAIREKTKNHEQLLAGWYRERQQQLKISLAKTIKNGELCTQGDTWSFVFAKLLIRIMQMIPSMNRKLEAGPSRECMIRYKAQEGLPFLGDFCGGRSLPQVYCAPISRCVQGLGVRFTDDVIFGPNKKGIFQILVLSKSLADLAAIRKALVGIGELARELLIEDEATFIVQDSEVRGLGVDVGDDVYRLATGEEFAADQTLCNGRPAPQLYDMNRIEKDLNGMTFIIVRPDRFVYAACETAEQLHSICRGIRNTVGLE
ncbi:hypothetical protein IFR05_002701 [Cadophora sp. M221]|nr:hypothetical protein IFR05_002701 [Cadophora sp. M221]